MNTELHKEINTIMNEYQELFVKRAFIITRNMDDAQDIVQDSFVKYIKYRQKGNEVKQPKAWFFMVIRNRAIDIIRKKNRRNQLDLNSIENANSVPEKFLPFSSNPEKELIKQEKSRLHRDALKSLNPNEQEILDMKFSQELSYKEIATQMNISVSNVGVTIHNAIKKIKTLVNKESV